MLSKCCTQYVTKSGKFSSGHCMTKVNPHPISQELKNVQLHSSHKQVRLCSKPCMLSLSITWMESFQVFKLGSEKTEDTRDPTANICWIIDKAREFQKNIYLCFIDSAKTFDCVDLNKLWETLKETGIPDHLTCLLRNLYVSQEATVRTLNGITDWFDKAVYCHPIYLTYMQSTAWEMPGWMSYKLESRLLGEISATSEMQMIMAENEKELKNLLMKVKEESEKMGLKLNTK